MSEQFFLVKFSMMSKSEEADIVPSAEFLVDADLSTNELPLLEALHKLQAQFTALIIDSPLGVVRPMTREEIEK